MLALRKIGPTKEGMILEDVPVPEFGMDEILVKVMCVGICGSDLHIWKDEKEHKEPVTIGHEYSGRVVSIGSKCSRIRVNDRICGDLETINGRIGTHIDGACAEYVVIPEALAHKIPDDVSYEEGSMIEMITCMAYDLNYRSRIKPSDFIVILGPGPIGLTVTQLVQLWSPSFVLVTGLKSDKLRLEMAKKMGANLTWYSDEKPEKKVLELTEGRGADLIIDATGGEDAITQATKMAKIGGWITVVGLWGHPIMVNLDMIPYNNLTVRGGWGWAGMESSSQAVRLASGFESWEEALKILALGNKLGKLKMAKMITRKITLDQWKDAYSDLEVKKGIKIIIYPNPDEYGP